MSFISLSLSLDLFVSSYFPISYADNDNDEHKISISWYNVTTHAHFACEPNVNVQNVKCHHQSFELRIVRNKCRGWLSMQCRISWNKKLKNQKCTWNETWSVINMEFTCYYHLFIYSLRLFLFRFSYSFYRFGLCPYKLANIHEKIDHLAWITGRERERRKKHRSTLLPITTLIHSVRFIKARKQNGKDSETDVCICI